MPIIIESRRKNPENLLKKYPESLLIDVTSKGEIPWLKFSPFYPHGNIPVPFSPGITSQSVEGIWQGLKVFETADIDVSKFEIGSMKGLKRSVRRFGSVKGHRQGVMGDKFLAYREARYKIYLPSYRWILENCLQDELERLNDLSRERTVLLLDYETNADIEDLAKPLSHASMIKRYIEHDWPV